MPVTTIDWSNEQVRIIDQTQLPLKVAYIECRTVPEVWTAIKQLKVRGAPAIGIAAALGTYVGMRDSKATTFDEFERELDDVAQYLMSSRPTAVNLFWAVERMKRIVREQKESSIPELKHALFEEAMAILAEDKEICRRIGLHGAELLADGDTVLTHCNAGALATADYGTALAAVYTAREQGKRVRVYADETRPLLQGSRLTVWELMNAKVEVTLICDNTAAQVMKEKKIDIVITGADRIAANGDTANKIGTYGLACLAFFHGIPFYVAAPVSTLDPAIPSGDRIPIEERGKEEVICGFGRAIAPENSTVYCPAFDVTPASLLHGIITEKGIVRPPFEKNLEQLL